MFKKKGALDPIVLALGLKPLSKKFSIPDLKVGAIQKEPPTKCIM
jgi:hypothetical protein